MGFFVGRTITYSIVCFLLVFGYWVYQALFAEETYNYFSMGNLKMALWGCGGAGILLAYFDPMSMKENQEQEPEYEDEIETKGRRGSSATAKAGFVMGAAALARSAKPAAIPQATSRDGGDRNISCQNIGKDRWIITYETLHPSTGWIPEKREINSTVSGFNTWGGNIDIRWHY